MSLYQSVITLSFPPSWCIFRMFCTLLASNTSTVTRSSLVTSWPTRDFQTTPERFSPMYSFDLLGARPQGAQGECNLLYCTILLLIVCTRTPQSYPATLRASPCHYHVIIVSLYLSPARGRLLYHVASGSSFSLAESLLMPARNLHSLLVATIFGDARAMHAFRQSSCSTAL